MGNAERAAKAREVAARLSDNPRAAVVAKALADLEDEDTAQGREYPDEGEK